LIAQGTGGYTVSVIVRGTYPPPYLQLAELLRAQIRGGELAPGQQLPTILDLAEAYKLGSPTVRKALAVLKAEGLIVGVPGYGSFVRKD
jgi:DNA-binding GntR family transcriptional regulator